MNVLERAKETERILEKKFSQFKISALISRATPETFECYWNFASRFFINPTEEITEATIQNKILIMLQEVKQLIETDIKKLKNDEPTTAENL